MKITTSVLSIACLLAVPAFGAVADTYAKNCVSCHGADGKGATAMGKKLKVLDYTTAEGQKWTDAEGVKAILEGKEKMKGYKDKGITEADAKELVKHIRSFKK